MSISPDAKEIWRWVNGYEGLYMVSDHGRVMSMPGTYEFRDGMRSKSGRLMELQDNGKGYKMVPLSRSGKTEFRTVHRLVAIAFLENKENKPDVNHIDGNKSNNRLSNLEWVTKKENMAHARDVLQTVPTNRDFTEEQIIAIRSDERCEREIADEYGVTQSTINAIRTGRTYRSFPGRISRVGKARQRKLCAEDVRTIRLSGESGKALAERYGVAASTICKIKKNKRYKEVI